jgi:predicted AlkP superfamily pyrophosphatase or phosphodiesterase
MIGELAATALNNDPDTVVAVVSDHGFIATHTAVNLRVPFVAAGLIELASPATAGAVPVIADWQAQVWPAAATAAVMLRDSADAALRTRVAKLLADLAAEPANGIARVEQRAEVMHGGGFPEADFLVEFAPGFYFGGAVHGDVLTPATSKGTHGYLPSRPEMHAAFFVRGRSIAARPLGVIDMRQIAPTFAAVLGIELPSARQPALALGRHP